MPATKHVYREFKPSTTSSEQQLHEKRDMEFRTPSWKDMYPVYRGMRVQELHAAIGRLYADKFDVARKFYVDVVMMELQREIQMQGVETAELRSPGDDCSAWELHSGTIWGLDRISHDGRPSAIKLPWNDGYVDDVGSPERFDVAAVVLLRNVCFEASYNYKSPTQTVSGQVSGKIDTVWLDMIIGHPEGSFPEVIWFKVTKYTCVRLSKKSVGVLNEKVLIEATQKVLHACVENAISESVLPVLNNLLKTIPYPDFT